MNVQVVKLLIEKLKSGKYKQGKNHLRVGDKFCCLGIACNLYMQETGQGQWKSTGFIVDNDLVYSFEDGTGDKDICLLPNDVQEWLDFKTVNGPYSNMSLSLLNDSGLTFNEIAKKLEQEIE